MTTAHARRRATRMSGDDRERAILEGAERLLRDRPLHEISVDEIARAAGISRPGFYFYFASRDAVLLTLLERMVSQARLDREAALAVAGEDPRAQWRAAINTFFTLFRDHRDLIRSVGIARATNTEVAELWTGILDSIAAETAAAIEDERARGAAVPGLPARDLAICLTQMTEQVFLTTLAGSDPHVAEEDVVETVLGVHLSAIYGVTGI